MTINQMSELFLKNIEKKIALIIEKKKQFSLESFIWGYHPYMEIWAIKVEDNSFYSKCEDGNEHNKRIVAVMIGVQKTQKTWVNFSRSFILFQTKAH